MILDLLRDESTQYVLRVWLLIGVVVVLSRPVVRRSLASWVRGGRDG